MPDYPHMPQYFVEDLAEAFKDHGCLFLIAWGEVGSDATHMRFNLSAYPATLAGCSPWKKFQDAIGAAEEEFGYDEG